MALMGRVIFMCGSAGSGKSTVARQPEQQGMTRLSFDQEARSRSEVRADHLGHPLPADPDSEHVRRIDGYLVLHPNADFHAGGSGQLSSASLR